MGSIGKNGTSNFTNASEWAWHVESRAWYASEWAWHVESRAWYAWHVESRTWYAEVTGYTATTVHVHFGPLLAGGVRRTNLLPTPIASCSPSNLMFSDESYVQ